MNQLRLIVVAFLLLVAHALFAAPAPMADFMLRAEKDPSLVRIYAAVTTVTYKVVGGTALRLIVYLPADLTPGQKRPAVVNFHGGGWLRGGPSASNPLLIYLASRGVIGVDAQYRLLPGEENGTGRGPQDCLADARSAMRWVRRNAAQFQIDPARISASGTSAGGLLAASLATIDGYDDPADDRAISVRPEAVLLLNPAIDLVKGWGTGRKHAIAAGLDPVAISPASHVRTNLPPFIILSGTKDGVCPAEVCRAFVREMKANGNHAVFAEFPGERHGFYHPKRANGANFNRVIRELDAFLAQIGLLPVDNGGRP